MYQKVQLLFNDLKRLNLSYVFKFCWEITEINILPLQYSYRIGHILRAWGVPQNLSQTLFKNTSIYLKYFQMHGYTIFMNAIIEEVVEKYYF